MSSTFSFGSNFKYNSLRKLWISDQLSQLTELLFFIDLSILEVGNNAIIIYNGAPDYNDTDYQSYLQQISSRVISFDSDVIIVWRQNTSVVNKYEIVENGFNSFVNSINKAESAYDDTQNYYPSILILSQFVKHLIDFYNRDSSLMMSADDLRIHLNIFKLISNALTNMGSKVKAIRQYIYVVSQNDSNHILYKSLQDLDTQLDTTSTSMIDLTNFMEKTLIYQLQNNISNSSNDFITLSSKVTTVKNQLDASHASLLSVFVNPNSNYSITTALSS